MASEIDRVGAYRGFPTETGVGQTKNGFPQFTVRLRATEKWVDSADEMKHFELAEPAWVDWSAYDQDIVGYLTLFGADKQNEGSMVPTFQIEQLQRALGWDGASFASLGTANFNEKLVTFWVEENEYNGNVRLQVSTLDAGDAPPVRQLRKLDAGGLKDLDARFSKLLAPKKPTVAPAKAGPATGKPPAAKTPPAPPSKSSAAPTAPTSTPTTKTPPASTAPAAKAPPAKGPPKMPPSKPVDSATDPVVETMNQAWDRVVQNKGKASDEQMADAWLKAAGDLGLSNKDDTAQDADAEWPQIADAAIKILNP